MHPPEHLLRGSGLARDGGGSLAASPTDRAPAYLTIDRYSIITLMN